MSKNEKLDETNKNHNKILIINTIKNEKPENTKQLITLMQERHNLTEEQTTELLMELENEGKLNFTIKEAPLPPTVGRYILSAKAAWYWVTLALATTTTIAVFTIPENAYPLTYLRYALGAIFVLFLPGYALIKTLFPSKVPFPTSSENIDNIERAALSLGMSLALTPIIGLILNYTPWGIRLTPVTLSLLALTAVLATAAIIREYQAKMK